MAVRQEVPEVARIGERLRKLRKLRGMTQSELARQIGIQQSDLSRMEKGTYRVSLDNLFKILTVFGMDVAQFFQQETAPPVKAAAAPLSQEDMQTLQMLRRLDPEARREVQEFLEFKLRRQRAEEREAELGDRSRWGRR
ncbi:MAG: helix-turn-helix transcriptional regulator [Acidobacteria bacterium]|nr:helix-turn-helix transcriptional regulator [Acidobacteriota bacterium]